MSRPAQGVSLSAEIVETIGVVEGARMLVDLVRANAPTAHDTAVAPHAASAILALLALRLRALGRVVRGEADITTILAPHNEVDVAATTDDVVLGPQQVRRKDQ